MVAPGLPAGLALCGPPHGHNRNARPLPGAAPSPTPYRLPLLLLEASLQLQVWPVSGDISALPLQMDSYGAAHGASKGHPGGWPHSVETRDPRRPARRVEHRGRWLGLTCGPVGTLLTGTFSCPQEAPIIRQPEITEGRFDTKRQNAWKKDLDTH